MLPKHPIISHQYCSCFGQIDRAVRSGAPKVTHNTSMFRCYGSLTKPSAPDTAQTTSHAFNPPPASTHRSKRITPTHPRRTPEGPLLRHHRLPNHLRLLLPLLPRPDQPGQLITTHEDPPTRPGHKLMRNLPASDPPPDRRLPMPSPTSDLPFVEQRQKVTINRTPILHIAPPHERHPHPARACTSESVTSKTNQTSSPRRVPSMSTSPGPPTSSLRHKRHQQRPKQKSKLQRRLRRSVSVSRRHR